ncbi:MAG: hypothetical protein AAB946_01700, partial [Patescibacteria group bacterium]
MNEIYSKGTYWRLVLFHIIFPLVLFGILFSISPFFLFIFYIPLGLVILSLLGIIIVSLQDKNVKTGYLIFINLAIEVYVWIWLLNITLDTLVKNSSSQEGHAYIWVLILLLASIFVHIFIACSVFASTSNRKFKLASLITFLFAILIGGGMIFNSINSLRPSEWKTFSHTDCGYEIKYPPTLNSYGGSFGNATCGYWIFSGSGRNELRIDTYSDSSQSIEEWLKNEWPNAVWTSFDPYTPMFGEEGHKLFFRGQRSDWLKYFADKSQDLFSKTENLSINNYQAIRLPTVSTGSGQSYAIFISNENGKIIKIECEYENDEMKNSCNEMTSTLEFT